MKHSKHRKHSDFIEVDIQLQFPLTFTKDNLDRLVTRAINEGIGDWAIITKATTKKRKGGGDESCEVNYTLPFQVENIDTNEKIIVTRDKLLRAIRDTLIDFPYALDTMAGYNLVVDKLTREDIDEIIQVAAYKDIQYRFVG